METFPLFIIQCGVCNRRGRLGTIPLCDGLHEFYDDDDLVSSTGQAVCRALAAANRAGRPNEARQPEQTKGPRPVCPCTHARAASEARILSHVLCCCEPRAAVPGQQPKLAQTWRVPSPAEFVEKRLYVDVLALACVSCRQGGDEGGDARYLGFPRSQVDMPAPETVPLLNAPPQRSEALPRSGQRLTSNYGPAQSAFANHLDVDEAQA